MNSETFKNTARKYYGDLTFEEAFKKTGRTVVITVTSSVQRRRRGKSHTLILNHITSPRVLIWSAVTCSCSLPGLMVSVLHGWAACFV